MPAPSIDYLALLPFIIVGAAAVIGVIVEAFVGRGARRPIQLVLTFGSLIAAFAALIWQSSNRGIQAEGALAIDGPGLVLMGLILLLGIVSAMLIAERQLDPAGDAFAPRASSLPGSQEERDLTARGYFQTEIWPLFLFAILGMMLFVTSTNLLVMFIALEIMSLPLYLMAGMARRRRLLSQEAALKYFILGAFSSAFFLFGMALVYGFAGSVEFSAISEALSAQPGQTALVVGGIGLLVVGLLFKIGAVPFHQWVPDVYQGSPAPVTAFMAAAVKVAGFGALFRVLYVALGGMRWDWEPVLWIIAGLTMLLGSIVAITQTDIKRMIAYSSIAQAGFILVGVSAASPQGLAAAIFYLIAYGFTTMGIFAVISMVRTSSGEITQLSQWSGLGRKSPLVATCFAIFMLALAGIPLTSGFIGKFLVFEAALSADAVILVLVGVLSSVIAAFFYVRVIVFMFFRDPVDDDVTVAVPSAFTTLALAISVAVTVVLGVVPQPVIDLVEQAGVFLR
ncbi:MAG: NADH-quinone oxidoreductase subunit NuoN [Candidatus Nanopelagicales bacterium]